MLVKEDFTDEVLLINEAHVNAANDFVKLIAAKYGVSPDKICDPLTYVAKRIGLLHGYVSCCLDYIGRDPVSHEGYNDEDIYLVKMRAYKDQLKELLKVVSAEDFTGQQINSNNGIYCMDLWRA